MISKDEHERIVSSGTDVPEETPELAMAIDRVGISSNLVWVRLKDMLLPFDSEITVDLPATARGIHMSRIEDVITRASDRAFESIKSYADFLSSEILKTQRGTRVNVSLGGHLPFKFFCGISGKTSMEGVKVFVRTEKKEGKLSFSELGMEVCHITACPCTQAYMDTYLKELTTPLPLPTHSQRTVTRLYAEDITGNLEFIHLFDCLQDALNLTQGLLKRPDEAELVLAAHERPQFVEDVVRDICVSADKILADNVAEDAVIRIESKSIESIHTHNVTAGLVREFREIRSCVQGRQK